MYFQSFTVIKYWIVINTAYKWLCVQTIEISSLNWEIFKDSYFCIAFLYQLFILIFLGVSGKFYNKI